MTKESLRYVEDWLSNKKMSTTIQSNEHHNDPETVNVEQRYVFDLMRVVLDLYGEEISFQQSNHFPTVD